MAIKKKAHEKLDDTNIKRVIAALTNENPITKKEACEMLNISYNTTRLSKIIEGFKEEAFDPQEGFVYSGGKLMRGLQNRRGKDLAMFNKAVPEKAPEVPLSS